MNETLKNLRKSGFSIKCLDIGARRGFSADLLPIAPIVEAIGFEPDKEECDKLNQNKKLHPWKSMKFLPMALGTGIKNSLNLYSQRGCSSLFEANLELAKIFNRENYFIFEGKVNIPVVSMDEAARKYDFENASFMKIDIQGAEMDVFNSGENLLAKSIVGIRIEISFLPLYIGQPIFSDIDVFLNRLGFKLMGFVEQHHWRRLTKIKYPFSSKTRYSLSRGQLVHSDALYLRMPESMLNNTEEDKKKILELALISGTYGYIDHAKAALSKKGMDSYMRNLNIDAGSLLLEFLKNLKRERRISLLKDIYRSIKILIGDM